MEKRYDSNVITPHEKQPELGAKIGYNELYFKREDLHPYGSHKGRSIPVMIDLYAEKGERNFVISSSGNAALAAAMHVQKLNSNLASNVNSNAKLNSAIKLDIFVGNRIAAHKLEKLKALTTNDIRVLIKEKPLQALTQAVQEGSRSLRQSTDDAALLGYETLAKELEKIPKLAAVFIGTSSGTTAQALASHIIQAKMPVQVHIVQTSSIHPMSETFQSYDGPDEKSIADAIVDITAHRKNTLVKLVEQTDGNGWIATNEDIRAAQIMTEQCSGLNISTNSALSVAGALKASYLGHEIDGAVVCLICGE